MVFNNKYWYRNTRLGENIYEIKFPDTLKQGIRDGTKHQF